MKTGRRVSAVWAGRVRVNRPVLYSVGLPMHCSKIGNEVQSGQQKSYPFQGDFELPTLTAASGEFGGFRGLWKSDPAWLGQVPHRNADGIGRHKRGGRHRRLANPLQLSAPFKRFRAEHRHFGAQQRLLIGSQLRFSSHNFDGSKRADLDLLMLSSSVLGNRTAWFFTSVQVAATRFHTTRRRLPRYWLIAV